MKNSFFILGFLISLLISCPPPTPVPGPDEGGNSSGNETAKEFTVSFDANGGTGTIAPMKVKAGTEITLPDGTAFTRKYYTFNYWTISGLDFYEEGSKYTVKADTVFSAEWRHNQVSITYDSNHEELNKKEETWGDAGSDLILPGNRFGSSPAGKYFYGWTTSDTATDEADILAPGSTFPVEETDLTFYAFWGTESVTEYKVNFSGTEMESITFNKYTEEIRLPLYTGEPGIICKGWDTDAAAKTVVYKDGDIIPKEKLTGDIVLYPILEDVRVALTWEKNGNVSPDNSDVFPDRVAPGDFFFMSYAVTKDSGDGKVWILDSVTAKTVSGKTVPTRKEMMDGIAEVWHISVPAEATVITLNWKEKTDVTVTSLTVYDYEYTEGDPVIDFGFIYKADFDPAKGNLKITKDEKEVEILSYHYEFYTAEEKVGYCELSPAAGEGQYQLQIIVNGKVLKEASFNVTFTKGDDPTTPQTHTVTFNANGGTGTVAPMTAEAGTAITLPSADGLSRKYYTFTAWETGEKQYNPGDPFTVNADTVFTAVWKSSSEVVSLTWNKNGAEILSPYLEESDLFPTTLTSDTTFTFPVYAVTKKPASGANPFCLTELTVETADGTMVAVSKQTNSESGLSEWSFTTGSENLNITLNWQEVTDPSVTISQILPFYNPGAMNVALTYLSCNFNPYPEMFSLYGDKSEKYEYELLAADYRFYVPVNGEYVFEIKWSETITGREHYYKVNATTGSTSDEYSFSLEPPKISLTYIKNGAEASLEYQTKAFPGTAIQGSTVNLDEVFYVKDDGTDTPYVLTGIKVTETESGTPVNVTKSDDGKGSPCWSFQAGTEPLTVELIWEVQSIDNHTFNVSMVYCEGNYIEMGVLTDIALLPGMITVTDEAGEPVIPSQKTAIGVEINDGIRTYSCSLKFSTNIPAGTTYKVIFTVSGETIHTETVTVPEPQP